MDHGTPSLSTNQTFELNILDVNQHAPIFAFPEEDQPVIFISRVSAFDATVEVLHLVDLLHFLLAYCNIIEFFMYSGFAGYGTITVLHQCR
jgi:hypothetical protein